MQTDANVYIGRLDHVYGQTLDENLPNTNRLYDDDDDDDDVCLVILKDMA